MSDPVAAASALVQRVSEDDAVWRRLRRMLAEMKAEASEAWLRRHVERLEEL
jgi:predicted ThiF/HesA family dinucleotide-utilizing enzyme